MLHDYFVELVSVCRGFGECRFPCFLVGALYDLVEHFCWTRGLILVLGMEWNGIDLSATINKGEKETLEIGRIIGSE